MTENPWYDREKITNAEVAQLHQMVNSKGWEIFINKVKCMQGTGSTDTATNIALSRKVRDHACGALSIVQDDLVFADQVEDVMQSFES